MQLAMKKLFKYTVLVIIVIAVLFSILFEFVASKGRQFDGSSKKFVDTHIPMFFSTLSRDELLPISTPETCESLKSSVFLFSKLKELGKFEKYEGSSGQSDMRFDDTDFKFIITAEYVASGTFQNSSAKMDLRLIWDGTSWKINRLGIYSPVFSK
jgi:hypothetical protein